MSSSNGTSHTNGDHSSPSIDAIETERNKANFLYREDVAPGIRVEMELKQLFCSTHSKYQKIDVIETSFGKVSEQICENSIYG